MSWYKWKWWRIARSWSNQTDEHTECGPDLTVQRWRKAFCIGDVAIYWRTH